MKTQDKQIMQMLQAFDQESVLKAIELYQQGIKDKFKETTDQLKEDGWEPFDEKPTDKEFYFFNEKYWVQNEIAREKFKQKFMKEQDEVKKQKAAEKREYTGQKMDLKQADILCSTCGAKMYKQSVCGGCKEGKQGFKVRLICEENPDHEILL